MNVPNWLKEAIATPRGFVGKKGELLKAQRMTAAECDKFNNRNKTKEDSLTIVDEVKEDSTVKLTNDHLNDSNDILDENELKKLTKLELETLARGYGIELDRRRTKKALLDELLEKIA